MKTTLPNHLAQLGLVTVVLSFSTILHSQVHYHKDGNPWKQKANKGPDSKVDGWYYNLGITGIRVQLLGDNPKALLVKYVFERTPSAGRIKVGDLLVGTGNKRFGTEHINGYGIGKFGADGPISEFARALEASQREKKSLIVMVKRGKKLKSVPLKIGNRYGAFAKTFPFLDKKADKIFDELCAYLAEEQKSDGSWGSVPQNLFAPLALMASGREKYRPHVQRNVKWHAKTTKAKDSSWLINWRYMAAGIVLSEYYLWNKKSWVKRELEEIYRFIISTQYMDQTQIDAKSRKERPEDMPKTKLRAVGGWGHNPGFEGYGPIAMLTGQGALVLSLMDHCGIQVDKKRLEAAFDFLERGTNKVGYLNYADEKAGDDTWADFGRTGASCIAHFLSPYKGMKYKKFARRHATFMGDHPEAFPDTHGSPILGMGFAAMGANTHPQSFQKLMKANRWWFTLAQCNDRSYCYQPNRDNAGYGDDSRIAASAVTAFILGISRRNLHITGKPFKKH